MGKNPANHSCQQTGRRSYTGVTSNLIKRICCLRRNRQCAKYHVHRLVWYEHTRHHGVRHYAKNSELKAGSKGEKNGTGYPQ